MFSEEFWEVRDDVVELRDDIILAFSGRHRDIQSDENRDGVRHYC